MIDLNYLKKAELYQKQALKRWFTDDYINKNPNIYEKNLFHA